MELPEYLYSRICGTARAVSDIAGKEIECMGYLLRKKGSCLVTDFFFPRQDGFDARSGTSDFPLREMYEKGFYIAGMWHSHGSFPLFHSETDYAHVANRLKAMGRESRLLDSWLLFSSENAIAMYNAEAMQGFKLLLKGNQEWREKGSQQKAGARVPEIKAKELLPNEFLSIVVNAGTYRKGKQCHAMRFSLDGNSLLKSGEEIQIVPSLPDETLEEIAENFYFNGKPLKESENYRRINAPKSKAEGKQVHLDCKKGSFLLECRTEKEANELQASISSIEELEEHEKKEIISNIPKPPSLEKKLDSILKKQTTALVPEKPYISNDDYLNGSKELHAMYAGKFISLAPYYTRAELESEKAMLDLLAALAGAFDSAGTMEKAMEARAVRVKKACSGIRKDALDNSARIALKEAARIIRGGNYSEADKRKMLAMIERKSGEKQESPGKEKAGRGKQAKRNKQGRQDA